MVFCLSALTIGEGKLPENQKGEELKERRTGRVCNSGLSVDLGDLFCGLVFCVQQMYAKVRLRPGGPLKNPLHK